MRGVNSLSCYVVMLGGLPRVLHVPAYVYTMRDVLFETLLRIHVSIRHMGGTSWEVNLVDPMFRPSFYLCEIYI